MPASTTQVTIAVNGATTVQTNQLSSTGASTGNLNSEVALVDNTQALISSSNGLTVQGQGTAGTASGGVVTVQGVASGTVIPANVSQVGGSALALGQALAAASLPIVLTAAQLTSLTAPVLAAGTANIGHVDGQGTAGTPAGGVITVQGVASGTALASNLTQVGGSAITIGQAVSGSSMPVVLPAAQITSLTAPVLAAGTNLVGKVGIDQTTQGTTNFTTNNITQVGGSALALGQALAAAALPVVLTAAQITSLTAPVLAAGTANIGHVDGEGTAGTPSGGVLTVQGVNSGNPLPTGTVIANPVASTMTRPANTTAYAVGQLVANSITAGSVVPFSFTATRIATGSFYGYRMRLQKSTTSTTNAAFRMHMFSATPTIATTGDGGVFATVVSGSANYLGYFDILFMQGFADGCAGHGAPGVGSVITAILGSGSTIYGLLEARGAYTPGSAETFTPTLEETQN